MYCALTRQAENGAEDNGTLDTAYIICEGGLARDICRTINAIENTQSSLKKLFEHIVNECVDGRLDEESFNDQLDTIARHLVENAAISKTEWLKADIEIKLAIRYCGIRSQGSIFTTRVIARARGSNKTAVVSNLGRALYSGWIEGLCRSIKRNLLYCHKFEIYVEYHIVLNYAIDVQRITGKRSEGSEFAILGLDTINGDEYVVDANGVKMVRHTSHDIYVSFHTGLTHDDIGYEWYTDYMVIPSTNIVSAVMVSTTNTAIVSVRCEQGALIMYVYDRSANIKYPIMCSISLF